MSLLGNWKLKWEGLKSEGTDKSRAVTRKAGKVVKKAEQEVKRHKVPVIKHKKEAPKKVHTFHIQEGRKAGSSKAKKRSR